MALTPITQALSRIFTPAGFMGPDADPNDPLAWLYRLEAQLIAERTGRAVALADGTYEWRIGLGTLDNYYVGIHPLPEIIDAETRLRFIEFMKRSKTNYMQTVIDSERQRLRWNGVRLGEDPDAEPDLQTWDLLGDDIEQTVLMGFQTALVQRRAYFSVWFDRSDPKTPKIAVEDPCEVIVEHDPADRRRRLAGLKLWLDEWDGTKLANVHLPTMTYKFRWHEGDSIRPAGWYEREASEVNPLGVVPFVPIVNRPGLALNPDGRSELDTLFPIQDRINQTVLHRQVAEDASAFRQKWATGMKIPKDKDGNPVQEYKPSIDSFWVNVDPTGKWGEFEATDLKNYDAPKMSDIQDIAIISATPRHYFTVNGQSPSGDSLRSAEAALVAKVVDFQRMSANPALREVVGLARRIAELDLQSVHPLWGDPEYQTFGQLVDGAAKLVQDKIVSRRYAREEIIGMTPATAQRVEQEILEEAQVEALNPQPEPPANATPPPNDS